MALNVTLYEFKKRENSTKRPDASVTQKTHEARLKAPTSLLHPVLTFDFTLKGNPSFYNYAYISDFGNRYYYIRDWTVEDGHIWRAQLDVDPLASWKNSIGESTQYVLRSSASYDGGIVDPIYPTVFPAVVEVTQVESPWSAILSNGTYVIGVVSDQTGGIGAAHYYALTQNQMSQFFAYMLGNVDWLGTITDITEDLTKVLFNPIQYITSCVWYPFKISGGTDVEAIPFGWWSVGVAAKELTQTFYYKTDNLTIPAHPQAASRGKYLNNAPFTRHTLYYPGIGSIVLDPALLTTDNLILNCAVDMAANVARLTVVCDKRIAIEFAQLGVPIQLAQLASNAALDIGKAGTSLLQSAGSFLSGNVAGAVAGVFNAIGSAINSGYPESTKLNSNGSVAAIAYSIELRSVFYKLVNEDNDDLGRPYCKKVQLQTVPGYQMVQHADIAIAGTSEENSAIKNYLESGYFYE